MALTAISGQKTWLNVKNGLIIKSEKDPESGEYSNTEHRAIEGLVTDIIIVEKTDLQGTPYKELQIGISDDENYMLCSRMFKPFSDGLLLSLGNADLTKPVRIAPYKGKESNGKNPPVYCSVRYQGEKDSIKWVEDIPAIEKIDQGTGEYVIVRKERNIALLQLVEDIKEKYSMPISSNQELKSNQEVLD